jgi:hypothetical protein
MMSTTAISRGDRLERRDARSGDARVHLGRFGLETAGFVAVLVSAWGGIVPYVGPLFNFSGDGSGAWHWNLAHSMLALVPGVVGVLLGLFIIAQARGISVGRGRLSLAGAGVLLMACGAWFAVGPLAWPLVVSNSAHYFVAVPPSTLLANEVGYSLGTGLLLVFCGAFTLGWASRHQPKSTIVNEGVAGGSPATAHAPAPDLADDPAVYASTV